SPDVVFAATNWGVFRSSDGGATWVAKNDGLQCNGYRATISHLAADPLASSVAYAASGCGVFKTTNSGENWTMLAPADADIFAVAAAPDGRPTTLFAGSSFETLRSTDGGATWARSLRMPSIPYNYEDIRDIAVDPTSADIVYVLTTQYAIERSAIYTSPDRGASWQRAAQLPLTTLLAFDPFDPVRMYAYGAAGVMTSTDRGVTWTPLFTANEVNVFRPSPHRLGELLFATHSIPAPCGIRRSRDGGRQWQQTNTGLSSRTVCSITAL